MFDNFSKHRFPSGGYQEFSPREIKQLIGDIDELWSWGLHNVWRENPNLFSAASLHFYTVMETLNKACLDMEGNDDDYKF